jgi:hypothetical protein
VLIRYTSSSFYSGRLEYISDVSEVKNTHSIINAYIYFFLLLLNFPFHLLPRRQINVHSRNLFLALDPFAMIFKKI